MSATFKTSDDGKKSYGKAKVFFGAAGFIRFTTWTKPAEEQCLMIIFKQVDVSKMFASGSLYSHHLDSIQPTTSTLTGAALRGHVD
ncbi:hypothetical protein BT96DRAFT_988934 [Gymnopus androsaceus JB14]|uniref:Uncharacterized protein n=1 Tax=Gymnopus androsaceus JB14 TaxID=1447944 RepID=A0A6A4I7R0_9AGAR|nr:hypothetical protein BT96DRAFT_988934 [Gymnopus androsaceus JB14]